MGHAPRIGSLKKKGQKGSTLGIQGQTGNHEPEKTNRRTKNANANDTLKPANGPFLSRRAKKKEEKKTKPSREEVRHQKNPGPSNSMFRPGASEKGKGKNARQQHSERSWENGVVKETKGWHCKGKRKKKTQHVQEKMGDETRAGNHGI